MKIGEFDYKVPKELIAQYPSEHRGDDRFLVLDRKRQSIEEKRFSCIVRYFKKDDVLVLNNSKVIPARIFGRRKTGGKVEIFLVNVTKNPYEALVRPSARIKYDEMISIGSNVNAKICGKTAIGKTVEFDKPLDEILNKYGHVPLPPYISRQDEEIDKERYQTIYASREGATASPTAGLHFTKKLIDVLKNKVVKIAYVTLHVSYGTFAPVKEEEIEKHKMHPEFYHISKENVDIINEAYHRKSQIFACGTTSLRALETCAEDIMKSRKAEGVTDLFIYPGYKFKIVKKLITNFHLPKSTLLLLTCAFGGKELVFKAYDYAIKNKFRFFSYGDAMLIK